MNKGKILMLLILAILTFSCQKGYKQEYKTFAEFNEKNERNKGWFPPIIHNDVTDLRNVSYLDPLCAFGKFNYKNSGFYDSIFSANEKISFDLFNNKVEQNIKLKPNWFLDLKEFDKSNVEVIKKEEFYVLKNKKDKTIYFILSNSIP
ncbi:hypothetical protein [Chryseobacterium daecheongense]|uniref:YbbD head domain-containing protein n=1 Tax=Chryseobacterium daecheongense TaxID=192389 RepID=A0A3N0VS50_9FLAO|nr:hypothetical protein [Chryseobacterium daecheongense]ROH95637.1 hypothetical protein EGI05_13970 [Chryseobacterium daecheongense]TDX91985.1 hypothetical protein BCF50_3127 [Chryseobacterium daecheongense]